MALTRTCSVSELFLGLVACTCTLAARDATSALTWKHICSGHQHATTLGWKLVKGNCYKVRC